MFQVPSWAKKLTAATNSLQTCWNTRVRYTIAHHNTTQQTCPRRKARNRSIELDQRTPFKKQYSERTRWRARVPQELVIQHEKETSPVLEEKHPARRLADAVHLAQRGRLRGRKHGTSEQQTVRHERARAERRKGPTKFANNQRRGVFEGIYAYGEVAESRKSGEGTIEPIHYVRTTASFTLSNQ